MEVHHHPHLPHGEKKKFKEYFLEFLMIFLAVTLGFFAETLREKISENSQATELAKNLYKEIYSDSVTIHQKILGRLEKEDFIKYYVQYVQDSDLVNLSPNFYPAFTSTFVSTLTIVFQPKDGVLNQLTNSGALRYFRSSRLQAEIGNISVDIANLRKGNDEEEAFRESKMHSFLIAHYDYKHSRQSSGKKESTDINALCDEYLSLSYHGLRAKDKGFNAEMKTDFDESVGRINLIPQDIGRVFLNLFNNAFYAVNEKQKAIVNKENTGKNISYQPTVWVNTEKEKDRVTITVKDNGSGIPEKIKEKIFQPFFTTKPTGSGTGLGLSLSYDIIMAHGGEIKVESKEGEGTRFLIELPVKLQQS